MEGMVTSEMLFLNPIRNGKFHAAVKSSRKHHLSDENPLKTSA